MKIEHVALYTFEMEKLKYFYTVYFSAVEGKPYHNPVTGLSTCFLTFPDGGGRLELMTRPQLQPTERPAFCPGYAHLAFSLGSRPAVDALTARLAADGYAVKSGPRLTGDGYYESCVLDPDGNEVELTA